MEQIAKEAVSDNIAPGNAANVTPEPIIDPDIKKAINEFRKVSIRKHLQKLEQSATPAPEKEGEDSEETEEGQEGAENVEKVKKGTGKKIKMKSAYTFLITIKVETMMVMKHLQEDRVPVQVTERLFIGSIASAMNRGKLKEEGITHVVCCIDRDFRPFSEDFEYLNVSVVDSPTSSIDEYFDKSNEFLTKAFDSDPKAKALIHWGLQKLHNPNSVRKMRFAEALELLQSKRSRCNPNTGFRKQLTDYDTKLFEQ